MIRPGEALAVTLAFAPGDVVRVGRLATNRRGIAAFEYDAAMIASGLRMHPLWDNPASGVIFAREPRVFGGLHGIFADSLPDAWGVEVMRRRARARGIDYTALGPIHRLALVGKSGVGALAYYPDHSEARDEAVDPDALAAGALALLNGQETDVADELARLGGSSGGARPKAFVARSTAGTMISGNGTIPDGYDGWILKFRSTYDAVDIGPLECAYADMARAAGIDVAPTMLIPAARGPGYFATKRFDREAHGVRRHVLSVSALLETAWSVPSIDYTTLHRLVRRVTRSHVLVEEMFRRMSFNAFAHNRDDHTKQHAFRMDRDGSWALAPAYDLTPSRGPGGEHYLAVNGKGSGITTDDLLAVARDVDIRPGRARKMIDRIREAVARFPTFARSYGVSKATIAECEPMLA